MKIKNICNISIIFALSFFWCDAPQCEVYVMQIFILYFNSKIHVVKGGKNQQLLERVNEEEDNESKLLLPNILFTIFIATINPTKHTLGIFHSIENPFYE